MLSIFMKKLTVNEAKNKVTTSDNAVRLFCPEAGGRHVLP